MNQPMEHHIIYISTASHLMAESELINLLDESRSWNLSHGITGLLVYVEGLFIDPASSNFHPQITGRFIQVLEGSKEELDYIFNQIQSDTRHHDIILMENTPQSDRDFETWQMGFRRFTLDEFQNNPGYFDIDRLTAEGAETLSENPALQFLKGFYQRGLSGNSPYSDL